MRKPVHFDGVMTAFTLALHHAAHINQLEAQLRRQEERLRARKFLFSAQQRVMSALRLEEDDAYSLLRRASMAQHMIIENLSCELMNDTESWLSRLRSMLAE